MKTSASSPKALARKTGQRCIASVLALSISLGAVSLPVQANPLDGSVVAGSATIGHEASLTTINQSSDRAIIDWRSFSVQKDETTHFIQPSTRAITVNRVTGNDLSAIHGNLRANGTVVLVNPNGVLFGPSGRVDVGGLIATVNDIDAKSFMSGDSSLRFTGGQNLQGSVVNEGAITIRGAGLSAFVAPHVRNSGSITASLGKVALGSGEGFTVDLYGDGLLSFAPANGLGQALSGETSALIDNSGTITATRVQLSAEAAETVVKESINLSGVIRATSASNRGGVIQLSGSGAVRIEKDAVLSASGASGAGSISSRSGAVAQCARIGGWKRSQG